MPLQYKHICQKFHFVVVRYLLLSIIIKQNLFFSFKTKLGIGNMPTVLNGFKHQRIAFNEFYFILMSKFYDSLPVVGFIRRYM